MQWLVGEQTISLTFNISKNLSYFTAQINNFSDTLWFWFGAMAFVLIVSQVFILRWGLLPIHQVVDELKRIESGSQLEILQTYPKEIEYLSSNINQLLNKEQQQNKRYRLALGDLAHSLKTPLAVLQNIVNEKPLDESEFNQQIQKMNQLVEYQLQRASTVGKNNLGSVVDITRLINRTWQSLKKVYPDKSVSIQFASPKVLFKADEGDMMELFGNLLDNAFKWTKSTVFIDVEKRKHTLYVSLKDDGEGFPKHLVDQMKQRGKRADQQKPGHGIGLSIVANIVESYNGEFTIENQLPQGAQITIVLN